MKDYYTLSLSGGKDSTATLHVVLENKLPLDEVIFSDVGMDFPQMYEHLDLIEKKTGITITRLKNDLSFEYYLYEHKYKDKQGNDRIGYTWPRPWYRWCTSMMKKGVINRHLHNIRKNYKIHSYVGIAADEEYRKKDVNCIYPLVQNNITEADALDMCTKLGYTWGGLYKYFERVSCWCCPLQPIADIRNLYKHFKDLWEKLEYMDSRVKENALCMRDVFNGYVAYCAGYGAIAYRARFDFEDIYTKETHKPCKGNPFFRAFRTYMHDIGMPRLDGTKPADTAPLLLPCCEKCSS